MVAATNFITAVQASIRGTCRQRDLKTRDIYIPDLHIDTIKVKARDFMLAGQLANFGERKSVSSS